MVVDDPDELHVDSHLFAEYPNLTILEVCGSTVLLKRISARFGGPDPEPARVLAAIQQALRNPCQSGPSSA